MVYIRGEGEMTERGTRVLNVGCGEKLVGTDFIDKYPCDKRVKRCDVDIDAFPFKPNTFDKVNSKNLLEHLRCPIKLFTESYRVLKNGGTLEVITDHASYWKWSLPNKAHSGGYHGRGEKDIHYALFTKEHLKNMAESAGFMVEELSFIGSGNLVRKIIDYVFRITPFRTMSYFRIRGKFRKVSRRSIKTRKNVR